MKTILVIEDDDSIRANILELLEAEQYMGMGAADGFTGLQMALQLLPDLIICDVMMPGLDGYQVLKQLRQNPLTQVIPVIFLTAKTTVADVYEGVKAGGSAYLTKPCHPADLLQVIQAHLIK